MRYYCKNCKVEYRFSYKDFLEELNDYGCPFCNNTNYELIPIPDYETPEQYERRTGKKWPENAPVWYRYKDQQDFKEWSWVLSRKLVADARNSREKLYILCAQSPEPPPNDWRPS